jgi:hypothetical protein
MKKTIPHHPAAREPVVVLGTALLWVAAGALI